MHDGAVYTNERGADEPAGNVSVYDGATVP